jgi:hypothetical protein
MDLRYFSSHAGTPCIITSTNLQKLLIKQELAELSALTSDHFTESCNLSSQITLSLVLFLKEFTGEVIDKL